MQRFLLLPAVALAACSDPATGPDAASGDAPSADARVPDASPPDASPPDAISPDASSACAQDQLCLQITPIDGVMVLPPGRLAIAWVDVGSGAVEVAYDAAWPADPVTAVDLASIAVPTAPFQMSAGFCPSGNFAVAAIVVSTDPDGSGSISPMEILTGQANRTNYGIGQEVVAWFQTACPAMPPDFPDGFLAGVHVYTEATPVIRLDGVVTALQTCAPGTAACDNIASPIL